MTKYKFFNNNSNVSSKLASDPHLAKFGVTEEFVQMHERVSDRANAGKEATFNPLEIYKEIQPMLKVMPSMSKSLYNRWVPGMKDSMAEMSEETKDQTLKMLSAIEALFF